LDDIMEKVTCLFAAEYQMPSSSDCGDNDLTLYNRDLRALLNSI
jgi:hypothetical protein